MLRSRAAAVASILILVPAMTAATGGMGTSRTLETTRPFRPQWVEVRVVDASVPGHTRLGHRFYDRARKRRRHDGGLLDWMPLVKGAPGDWQVLDLVHPAGCTRLHVSVPDASPGRRNPLAPRTALLDGADGPDTSSRHALDACEVLVHTEAVGSGATDLVVVLRWRELARVRRTNAGDLDPLLLVNLPTAALFDAATLPLQVAGTIWFLVCYPRGC